MNYIGAIDQGTTSTRFILFDENGSLVASYQLEHKQIYPQPGWVEHNPYEIWANTCTCITKTLEKARVRADQIKGVGITNQRETVVAWNPKTGRVYYNAIVWQDLRGAQLINELQEKVTIEHVQEKTGLRMSPYFAASKIAWMLSHVPGLRSAARSGNVVFGTIDSWLLYNLTGGQVVATDATNASRYMLMDIRTLQWDEEMLSLFDIPRETLPAIKPSVGEVYGRTVLDGPFLGEVPVCGILGDQQAALFGQACFTEGLGKCTYGTGCFLLENTGERLAVSKNGLLSTVAYQIKGQKPRYALEGSIAVAGSLVQWARDNLKIVGSAPELDELAESVPDCGGVYIVPAFSGLFAPYWRSDARGVIAGLTAYATRAHLCRAILEATALQANDLFEAMEMDSGIHIKELKVDGGLTNSRPLMEFQSDLLAIPVIRPKIVETTALGAAYAAGLTCGVFRDFDQLRSQWQEERRWEPRMSQAEREKKILKWRKAVSRTLNWIGQNEE